MIGPEKREISPAVDILEFGAMLVAATPRLCREVRQMTAGSDETTYLVQATLREAWRARRTFCEGASPLHDWLLMVMKRHVLH